jgi:YD repeat-containing protein
LWKSQDRAGVARILTYDLQGNVTAEYKSDEINLMLSGSTQAYIEAEASDPSRKRVQKTQNQYDDLGRVVRQSLPGYFIDANLNGVFETTEWRVPQLNQDFDRWGNITKSTNAAGAFEQFDYDSRNNLIRQRGVAVTAYGEHGALVGGAIQAHTLFGYDKVGNRIAQLDSRGYAKATAFNAAGRMLAEYHSDKGESYYYYDEFGRQTYEVDPRLRSTRWDYDNNDQVIAVVGGNGSRVEYEYDALGQRIIQRTRLYSADNPVYAVQRQVFDGLGRLRRDVNPSGIATSYDYDALGNKTYQGNALADYQTWSYDEYGRVTSHRDMSGATTSYTNYNLLGQARNQSNPSVGQNLAFNYDHAGRLRQITDSQSRYGGLPRSTTYDYNIRGLTTREVDKTGTTTVRDLQTRYDAAGRLLSIEDYRGSASSTVELNYYYDIAGNRKLLLFQHRNFSNVVKTGNYWYRYDAMNRLTVSKGGRFIDSSGNYFISFNQNHGARLGYDLAGNRVSEESFEGTTLTKRDYIYDGENRLTSIRRDGIIEHDRSYDNAGRVIQTRDYTDGVARVLNYNEYYLDGRVRFRRTAKSEASNPDLFFFQQKIRFDYADSYDAAGNLRKYTLENFEGQYYVNTYTYSYLKRDQYLQSNESGQSTYFQSGSTRQDYDANGNVYAVDDSRNSANDRTFTINARGETIQKFQTNNGAYYFYANGQQVAWFDQAGKSDFDFNYRAISDQYPTETPSSYVVLEGDTLQTVSLAVYGDASLWYLIADANGLAGSEALAAGLRLTIPNRVSNFRNTSETFKPYSPGDIIGDTTPTLPAPPPPKKKCGTFLQIVVIAVAVVATALTAGAATAVLGPAAATVGGSLAAAGATVAAAAVGAAAGSVASQFAAIGLGLQEDFSFSEVGRAAVSGGLTAGVGTIPGVSSWSTWARTTLSTSLSQGVNVALGYQDRFSWTGVAAAAITSKVFGNTGDLTDTATPLASGLGIAQDFGRFFAAGTLNRTISVALEGRGKIELTEVAADAFGNALGNSIVGKIKQSTTDQQKRVADLRVAMVEEEAARSGDFGRMEASNDAGGSVRPSPVSISQAEYDELVNSGRLGTPGYSVAKLEQIGIRSAAGAGGGIQTFAYRDPAEGLGTPAPIPPSVTPRSDPGVGAFARNSLYALGGLQAFGDLELSILGGIKTLGGTLIPGSMGDSSGWPWATALIALWVGRAAIIR